MGKLSYEDKVNLYYDRKKHIPLSTISKKYKTTVDNVQFLERLIDKHGFEILTNRKSYSNYEKEQISDMLNKAFKKNNNLDGLIFHSNQGWQYQHQSYQQRLKNKKIKQSMSRKGNNMDNGMMENFFGLLKTEMFYDQEDNYKTIDELILAIEDYIYYYNYDRIKEKLKGLYPVNYRLQSLNYCPTFGVQFKVGTGLLYLTIQN